ncbi:MAG: hypothetical protein JRN20_18270 [Nitrososphaerota archaeon]|nr:hypothetical protein [Nitrososphaerota archaeon]
MKKESGAILLVVFVLILAVTLAYALSPKSSVGTTSISTSTSSVSGLILSLSLNSSIIQIGHGISFSASLFNSLSTENNVSTASNWALPGLVLGPCGPTDSPIAFAVVKGFYTASNISSAPRVQYGLGCTTLMGGIQMYSFKPMSSNATVIGNCEMNRCLIEPMIMTRSVDGYWSGNSFVSFTQGAYTGVVADEWGSFTVAQFTVTS